MKSGVYKILNIINNKVYIGSSKGIPRRWREHLSSLKNNIHYNSYLQNAFNKYKEENFKWKVIEYCPNKNLKDREQCWMDFYQSYNPEYGYNLSPTAGNTLGYKHTDETKQKLSKAFKGIPLSEEHRKNIGLAQKGIPSGRKGIPLSEEHKIKLSLVKKGVPSPRKGVPLSEETKQLMSLARLGKKYGPMSEEGRRNISLAKKGKPSGKKGRKLSEEHNKNMGLGHKGKKYKKRIKDEING